MAQFDDIELVERLFLKGYPFQRYSPRPENPASLAITPLRKALSASTVAIVTTAGLSMPDQPPFDATIKMGDSSFREFPGEISPQHLEMNHRSWSFDQTGVLRDRNLVMPLDRLREMQQRGEMGYVAPHHYSFMGSIVGPAKLMKESVIARSQPPIWWESSCRRVVSILAQRHEAKQNLPLPDRKEQDKPC